MAFLCLFFSFFFGFLLFKNKIHSLIDPLLIYVISFCFSLSVAFFLFICGVVDNDKVCYFLIGQAILLIIIYCIFPNKNIVFKYKNNREKNGINENITIFYICFLLFLMVSVSYFGINGIPLFQSTRYEINADNNSGILGFFTRIREAVSLFVVLFSFDLYDRGKHRLSIFILFTILLITFLFGSKGFITSIVFPYYFYRFFYIGYLIYWFFK